MATFFLSPVAGYDQDIRSPQKWFGLGVYVWVLGNGEESRFVFDAAGFSWLQALILREAANTFVSHDMVWTLHFLRNFGISYPQKIFCTKTASQFHLPRKDAGDGVDAKDFELKSCLNRLGLITKYPELESTATQIVKDEEAAAMDPSVAESVAAATARAVFRLYKELKGRGAEYPEYLNEYIKTIPSIEAEGLPLDLKTRDLIYGQKERIVSEIVAGVNCFFPLMTETGKFDPVQVETFFTRLGKLDPKWKRTTSQVLSMEADLLTAAADCLPPGTYRTFFDKALKEKSIVDALTTNSLVVDGGKNFHQVNAFGALTGRNTPTGFIFNGSKWQRFLLVPEKDHALLYVDFKAQELGIAAALSGDPGLKALYAAKDPYLAFACASGVDLGGCAPEEVESIRGMFKVVALGVLYGKEAWGIKVTLGVELKVAENLLAAHKRLFPQFWSWQASLLKEFAATGYMETNLGWRCKIDGCSAKTQQNFKIQGTGADIMRLATVYMRQQDLRVLGLVHDGFLLTARIDEVEAAKGMIDDALTLGVQQALPGFSLRWVHEVHRERFFPCKLNDDTHRTWLRLLKMAEVGI